MQTIDARGLACPLPVLKLRKALKACEPGAALVLLATDPAAARDIPAFCAAAGHRLVAQSREQNVLRFEIEAGSR
jgi:tRNA 2-thiouridine synthesizing protein A